MWFWVVDFVVSAFVSDGEEARERKDRKRGRLLDFDGKRCSSRCFLVLAAFCSSSLDTDICCAERFFWL